MLPSGRPHEASPSSMLSAVASPAASRYRWLGALRRVPFWAWIALAAAIPLLSALLDAASRSPSDGPAAERPLALLLAGLGLGVALIASRFVVRWPRPLARDTVRPVSQPHGDGPARALVQPHERPTPSPDPACQQALLAALDEATLEGLIVVSPAGEVLSYNRRFAEMWGIPEADLATRSIAIARRAALEQIPDPDAFMARIHYLESHPELVATDEIQLKDGRTFERYSAAIWAPDGTYLGRVWRHRDITERKRAERALARLAYTDTLTGLPNRLFLRDQLNHYLLEAGREQRSLALLVLDLDNFREANDTFGHDWGDQLLQQVAERLSAQAGPEDLVARLGGDEFALLLPHADEARAVAVARQLLKALEEPISLDNQSLIVNASIGIALFPQHGEQSDTLLRRTDVALYVAKRSDRGYAVYSAAEDKHSPARIRLIGELRQALARDELRLHFQPKLDLRRNEVCGVEGLVRWQHRAHGLVLPDQFIPLAEQTGLIRPLGLWVLDAALRQVHAWQRLGQTVAVAINLSMRNLHDPALAQTIADLLQRWEVEPRLLTLEITESALMADAERVVGVLKRLRALGVRVAIDDLGTGFSSLAYLRWLPVDQLKIDKAFVHDLAASPRAAAIVRSIVDLGHNLGLTVVAEGVESAAVLDLLTQLGCDCAQGYYLSQPLPAGALLDWLKARAAGPEGASSSP